jgi:hypothetical protein
LVGAEELLEGGFPEEIDRGKVEGKGADGVQEEQQLCLG